MSAAITVSLIILLAGFGIFNVLTMSVLAKIKEIAILRSMGYRRRDISLDFLVAGRTDRRRRIFARLFAGCDNDLGHIAYSDSDPRFALCRLLPGTWEWRHYVFATLLAILAVFIASYVPARRAAELPPVATIRGAR